MKKTRLFVLALFLSMLFGMTAMAKGSAGGDVELKTEELKAKVVMNGQTVEGEIETSFHYGGSRGLTDEGAKKLVNSDKDFATYFRRISLWMETGKKDEWGDDEEVIVRLAPGTTIELEFSVLGVTSRSKVYVLTYDQDDGWSNNTKVTEKGTGYIKVRFSSDPGTIAIMVEKEGGSQSSIAAPAAVQELKAAPIKVNAIELSWDEIPGASKYEIRYGTTSDFSQAKRLTSTKKTSYKFSKAKCGVDYYFWIQASNKGGKSIWTELAEPCRTELTGKPVVTIKKQTYNSIAIKWTKVTGAKKYMVYRLDEEGLTLLKTQGGTSYTDKKLATGESYSYVVMPVRDWDYGEDNASDLVTGKTVLQKITKLKAKAAGTDSIRLSWKKVPGVVTYEVYRLNEETGEYDLIRDNGIRTSYTDTGLSAGKVYSYKVIGRTSGGRRATSTLWSAEVIKGTTKNLKN